MPELRKDPVIGRWVIIATERSLRPNDYKIESEEKNKDLSKCPFEEGNESLTPPEILSYRKPNTNKNGPGWWVRVVPNKFPALRIEGELDKRGVGMYDMMNGIGAHEVVIETPNHFEEIAFMPETQIQEIIWAWRDRVLDLKKDKRFKYILIFKNKGAQAGASLEHPHSQIIALPIVPIRVQQELNGAKEYFNFKDRCVFCDMVQQELEDRERLVEENHEFISIVPFAARFPFELWILPKKHSSDFIEVSKADVVSLSIVLKRSLLRLKNLLNDPPYNLIIHTSPLDQYNLPHYHWHIEIMPRLTKVAGFEWGTGFYINPTKPEDCAKFLRELEI
ncbi:MAG: galactose-1-phosphate uridylyltransferase [Caldisericia bacterium]|jgi:UDPglucose--hexose-1-phosphate uridylyltransferase|nr:galactose-1-phosphate uridylyltransferase [Caldisericia bacterium]